MYVIDARPYFITCPWSSVQTIKVALAPISKKKILKHFLLWFLSAFKISILLPLASQHLGPDTPQLTSQGPSVNTLEALRNPLILCWRGQNYRNAVVLTGLQCEKQPPAIKWPLLIGLKTFSNTSINRRSAFLLKTRGEWDIIVYILRMSVPKALLPN